MPRPRKREHLAGLGPGGTLSCSGPLSVGTSIGAPKRGLGVADRHLADQVAAFAVEKGVLLDVDRAVAIARRTAGGARLAFPAEAQLRAVVDALGDLDLAVDAAAAHSRCPGRPCRLRESPGRCRGRRGRASAARRSHWPAPPGRCRRNTGTFRPGARLGPRAAAGLAGGMSLELDDLRGAAGRLQQVQRDFALDVAAWRARRPPRPPAEKIAEEAFAEHVAKGLENVADVAEVRRIAALQALEAVAVVLGPLFRMAEHLEGLGRLLEFDHRRLVTRVAVGVILQGQFAIGLGNLFLACGAIDPQNFVVIAFVSHRHHILAYRTRSECKAKKGPPGRKVAPHLARPWGAARWSFGEPERIRRRRVTTGFSSHSGLAACRLADAPSTRLSSYRPFPGR